MLGSEALEVALGLVLTYLLLSIIMTGVEELLSSVFKTRAKTLTTALLQIMQNDQALVDAFYKHPLISAFYRGNYDEIQARQSRWKPWLNGLPSYIPRETFSAAIADLEQRVPAESAARLREVLAILPTDTEGKLRTARQRVEAWYDGAMDRAAGWYKRRTQTRLFLVGLIGSIVFNVNSISIAHYLAVHPEQRELVAKLADRVAVEGIEGAEGNTVGAAAGGSGQRFCVREGQSDIVVDSDEARANAMAQSFNPSEEAAAEAEAATVQTTSEPRPSNLACWTGEQVRSYTDELVASGLPVGWGQDSREWLFRGFPKPEKDKATGQEKGPDWPAWTIAWLLLLLGYFITAVAMVLGAPFWFDILNKIMVIRGTVKPKEKSPDEPPVDGPKPARGGRASE